MNAPPATAAPAVATLLARYRAVIAHKSVESSKLVPGFNTLRLADAALDKLELNRAFPNHPPQIVILGPTQAGKSTLVNLLLDAPAAGISALAGFTVHAQGFAIDCPEAQLTTLEQVLHPLRRVPAAQLDPANLDYFALQSVTPGPTAMLASAVVWDSPDFDSIESAGYRGAVLQSAAIADLIILLVSKDKYADKSVWDMLAILRSLGKPLLICINKLDLHDEQTVLNSFRNRHQRQFGESAPTIITLPFIAKSIDTKPIEKNPREFGQDATLIVPKLISASLQAAVQSSLQQMDRGAQSLAVNAFIDSHWAGWMEPVNDERAAAHNWRDAVKAAVDGAEVTYINRFLEDPQKYNTFNRALAELLTLLEIPGLAATLERTRHWVTWPARTLFGLGKKVVMREASEVTTDQELDVLEQVLDQALTRLQGHILVQQEDSTEQHAWWRAMHQTFREQRKPLGMQYLSTAEACQQEFTPRIEQAAQKLYSQLQSQPVLLNTLRATRFTADAAAVALAVKSGGLAPADLIIAPAMLSVTTLLTESALGRYMDSLKRDLKREQQTLIRERLFEQILSAELTNFADLLDEKTLLMVDFD